MEEVKPEHLIKYSKLSQKLAKNKDSIRSRDNMPDKYKEKVEFLIRGLEYLLSEIDKM